MQTAAARGRCRAKRYAIRTATWPYGLRRFARNFQFRLAEIRGRTRTEQVSNDSALYVRLT
jgi:hypothetical protein